MCGQGWPDSETTYGVGKPPRLAANLTGLHPVGMPTPSGCTGSLGAVSQAATVRIAPPTLTLAPTPSIDAPKDGEAAISSDASAAP